MHAAERLARGLLRPVRRRLEPHVRRWFPTQLDNLEWNRKMAEGYVRTSSRAGEEPLGREWGAPPEDVAAILDEYVFPYIGPASVVAEIGVGGGRIAVRVAPRVRRFYGFDISPGMLRAARDVLADRDNVELVLLDEPRLPRKLAAEVDFAYSFATFLHLDLHMMWRYFAEMTRVLRPGGHAFVHTATITTPGGWDRFASQETYSVLGFYFVSPEIVQTLAAHAGLTPVKASEPDERNAYLNRDYFALFRR
jgi:SAM-dependent methyltransferase